jgi:hypothetical protein
MENVDVLGEAFVNVAYDELKELKPNWLSNWKSRAP